MPATKANDPPEGDASITSNELKSLIGQCVVRRLGSPADMLNVKVHPVGNDRYRVNVLAGKSPAWARITDSFYLTADGGGDVTSSSPEILRLY